jgi:hypothetical protein
MSASLGGVALPDDLEWVDEFDWSPAAQQLEVSLAGALIIEESAQLTGRPITLRSGQEGSNYFAVATRATVEALQALVNTPRQQSTPMALELPDGRTTTVLFRGSGAERFSARPWKHIVPQQATDYYLIELRLLAVSAIVTPDP